jgi:membrane associated rhomboid family serine protease
MAIDKITLAIIIINVLISYQGFQNRGFLERYKFQVGPVAEKDWIRLLSSGFLHVDYMHLIFNMLTLYFFAPWVIHDYGKLGFVAIYFGSLLAGNIYSFFQHRNEYFYSAVGASGAVMGVLYAFILLHPLNTIYLYFIPVPAILLGIGYLLYSIYGMKESLGNIGHAAHLGGALAGLLISLAFKPYLLTQRTLIIILLLLPLVFLLWKERGKR